MRDGFLGLYLISLVTGSIKPRPEASNPRIASTGAGSGLIHRSAWKGNSPKFGCSILYSSRLSGQMRALERARRILFNTTSRGAG
jgi:hypothetical protein